MIIKLDREYEVKCTLGTIRDIEDSFKKSFVEIVSDIGKLSTREQMKMLFRTQYRNAVGRERRTVRFGKELGAYQERQRSAAQKTARRNEKRQRFNF